MKRLYFPALQIALVFLFAHCSNNDNEIKQLETRVKSINTIQQGYQDDLDQQKKDLKPLNARIDSLILLCDEVSDSSKLYVQLNRDAVGCILDEDKTSRDVVKELINAKDDKEVVLLLLDRLLVADYKKKHPGAIDSARLTLWTFDHRKKILLGTIDKLRRTHADQQQALEGLSQKIDQLEEERRALRHQISALR